MGGAARTNELTPGYGWNAEAGRYIDLQTGRFVSQAQVRTALDQAIDSAQHEIRSVSQALVDGRINLVTWQTAMAHEIKMIHLASGCLARGGWAQMTPADWGRVGAALRKQYQYLQNFARQIESGAQKVNGALIVRALLYGQAGRGTYEQIRKMLMLERGMQFERRVLGVAEHCDDCLDYAGRGWQLIGTLPRIGDSQCVTNCHCTFDYRERLPADLIGGFGL